MEVLNKDRFDYETYGNTIDYVFKGEETGFGLQVFNRVAPRELVYAEVPSFASLSVETMNVCVDYIIVDH